MSAFTMNPMPVEQVFPGFENQPRMDLVEAGVLVTQAKWEEDVWNRVSSCYPAAIINGAILVGALAPDVGYALHQRLLSLPDNWMYTTHPDPKVKTRIQGFRFGARLQQSSEYGADDVMYQGYAGLHEPKAFSLRQLMHVHTQQVLVDGELAGTSKRLIRGVLGQTVVVSGIAQHATTIVLHDGQLLEINPRHPHDPEPIDIEKLSRTWVRKTGPVNNRRILEAVVNPRPKFLDPSPESDD